MTDASTFLNQGLSHAEKAIRYDRTACESCDPADFDNAKDSYFRASEYFFTALKYEKNERRKTEIRSKISSYLDRIEIIKEWLKSYKENQERLQQRKTAPKTSRTSSTGNSKKKERKTKREETNDDDHEDEQLQSRLSTAILAEKPDVKWRDVAGLEAAKDALKEAVILPQKFPQMFTGKRRPWKGILLYGPPGTGKSYLAKAVATEADAKFFSVSSSDLVSKWQGESEKLVKQLFTMARNAGKAIIFIDEIDALVSIRSSNESESSRRIKTEFLVQMDGVGKSSEGVLLLGATNIPWGLDDALLRRMERRVYIPLPDASARARMFELHIENTPHELGAEDFKELGMASEGYSGSDIKIVCRDAMMQPVRTIQNASFFKYVMVEEDGRQVRKVTPCSPGDKGGVEMKLMSISSDELLAPAITRRDFEMALMKTKPSVGKDAIVRHMKFTREKGQSGV